MREEFPEYAARHSPVLQDVLARLDRTYQACFRRVQRGEKAGFPRFKGRTRWRSFSCKEYGNGARLDNGSLVRATIGRLAVHWSRPLNGTPKTITMSRQAAGWYVAICCSAVPTQPVPPTGQETGRDLGIEAFARLATGERLFSPRVSRRAERALATCQRRVSQRVRGSQRRRKATGWLATAHQQVRRHRQDCHHKTALALVRQYAVISSENLRSPLWCGTSTSLSAAVLRAGGGSWPSFPSRLHAPVGKWLR
ncbi:MAG TPA: transposase [Ktedonobacterales bacterium]|nr:transposase [Ktedonobacterales bacterium]